MRLVVVGGGVSGLSAAHRAVEWSQARRRRLDLLLLEARPRLGGTIVTEQVGQFLVEAGPDSFLSEKPWALDLCRRLGVEGELVPTDDRYRQVLVWFERNLHPLPEGFQLLAPGRLRPFLGSTLFSWPGKLRMALDLVLPRGTGDDESLGAFVRRRLGRQALERVAQPLVAGIYTADPDQLSLAATMPRFLDLERRERSLILGLMRAARRAPAAGTSGARWSLFVTFRDGMIRLVEALAGRLPPGSVRTGQRVRALERAGAGWRVAVEGAESVAADAVIVAAEAYATARLLRHTDPQLAAWLDEIPYASSATVSLGYRRQDVPHRLEAFGIVVPRTQGLDSLACTFSSVKYPGRAPDGRVLLRCFLGGATRPRLLEEDDKHLIARARADLVDLLGVTSEPVLARLHRWPNAMAQYHLGHLARVESIERRLAALPGLALAGSAYRGVGIADCVRSGEAAAEALLGEVESAAGAGRV